MLSLADRWSEEGFNQGYEEIRIKLARATKITLQLKFQNTTPWEAQIKAADLATLKRLIHRIPTADTTAAIFAP